MRAILQLGCLFILISSCSTSSLEIVNYGHAQGTTYSIRYIQEEKHDYQKSIDSILINIDRSMSLWVESSLISKVNRGDSAVQLDPHFVNVLKRSIIIGQETKGSFDVTVAPLVKAWGFNNGKFQHLDSTTVDSIKNLVGYQHILLSGNQVQLRENQQLDFNAIAQGYSVDVICVFLESKGVNNYMVEVGGELRTKGQNREGNVWRIGIDKPQEELDSENRFQIVLNLSDKALATSGNYRKFFTDENGMKYVHTINPKTGYPVKSKLLSATIITDHCMDADAYATACMVDGLGKAQQLIESKQELEGYLIYSNSKGEIQEWFSSDFKKFR
jgi:thiamine biosynthesis lipoprotein